MLWKKPSYYFRGRVGAVKVVHLSIHLCRYKRWSINSLICLSNHSVGFLREKFCTIPSKIRTFCDVNWTTTGAPDHYKSHSVNYDERCPLLLLLIISAHHRMVAPSLINKNAGVLDVMNGSVRSKRFQSSYCAKGRFFLLSSQLFSTNSRENAWYAGYMNGNRKFGFSLDETLVSDIPRWKLLLNSSSMMLSSQKTD